MSFVVLINIAQLVCIHITEKTEKGSMAIQWKVMIQMNRQIGSSRNFVGNFGLNSAKISSTD